MVDNVNLDFNQEFQHAYHMIEESNNFVFVTGKAGTGKSTLLKYIYQNSKKKVVLLAPTGVAALNIGGVTIHSFFKFPPRPLSKEDIHQLPNNEIYQLVDTIIIDEISMVRSDLLDAIERFMRLNGRDSKKPFGGVQMVFFGDLYQLSPIIGDEEEARLFGSVYSSPWFFDAKSLDQVDLYVIELMNVYRQKDVHFIELLDSIRINRVTQEQLDIVNNRVGVLFQEKDNESITLTCTNRRAQNINFQKLNQINSPEFAYLGRVEGEFPKKTLPTDIELRLKVGAQVMFIKNDVQRRWVNGTIGKVNYLDGDAIKVEVMKEREPYIYNVGLENWEILKYKYDTRSHSIKTDVIGRFTQYPIKLAWAITIYKSQGLTFEKVIIDLENRAFAFGQTYVALSRCVSLEGIALERKVRHDDIKVDIAVSSFLESAKEKGIIEKNGNEILFTEKQESMYENSSVKQHSETTTENQDKSRILIGDMTIEKQKDEVVSGANDNLAETFQQKQATFTSRMDGKWVPIGIQVLLLFVIIVLWSISNDLSKKNNNVNPIFTITHVSTKLPNTKIPVATLTKIITEEAEILPIPSSTISPNCIIWSEVDLNSVGKKMCVFGSVAGIFQEGQIYYIKFRNQKGDFYVVSYGENFTQEINRNCIEIEGVVERIGSSPVIVLDKDSNLRFCQNETAP